MGIISFPKMVIFSPHLLGYSKPWDDDTLKNRSKESSVWAEVNVGGSGKPLLFCWEKFMPKTIYFAWVDLVALSLYLHRIGEREAFDCQISFECLRADASPELQPVLQAEIDQASTLYVPDRCDEATSFHDQYKALCERDFPDLVVKRCPNEKA